VDENDRNAVLKDIENMRKETAQSIQTSREESINQIVNAYSPKIEALQHIQTILNESRQI
jgi:molecular chaperone GrpE (heat shock protein)